MFQTEYLHKHIDALLRLSHDVKDRAVSAELREMADEFRIMVSVSDITDLAAALNKNAVPLAADSIGAGAVSSGTLGVAGEVSTDHRHRDCVQPTPRGPFGCESQAPGRCGAGGP
jgi:hypothetical protein